MFGYGTFWSFGSIVATGAGLHAAAYYIEHHSKLGSAATVLSVAIPVAAYIATVYVLYMLLVHTWDAFHVLLVVLTAAVVVASVALAAAGLSMSVCLLIVMLAPLVTVVGFELIGHRHAAEAVSRSLTDGSDGAYAGPVIFPLRMSSRHCCRVFPRLLHAHFLLGLDARVVRLVGRAGALLKTEWAPCWCTATRPSRLSWAAWSSTQRPCSGDARCAQRGAVRPEQHDRYTGDRRRRAEFPGGIRLEEGDAVISRSRPNRTSVTAETPISSSASITATIDRRPSPLTRPFSPAAGRDRCLRPTRDR